MAVVISTTKGRICRIILTLALCSTPYWGHARQPQVSPGNVSTKAAGLPQSPPPSLVKVWGSKVFSWLSLSWNQAVTWGIGHPVSAGIILWVGGFSGLWAILLATTPMGLLFFLRFFASVSEFSVFGLKFPKLEYVTLLSFFAYRDRVLDRWVALHIEHARREFEGRDTVKERSQWVDLPVKSDQQSIPKQFSPSDLRPYFARPQLQMLIYGDGGSGKTSLACQIARWSMTPRNALRPRLQIMIPLLLESDFLQSEDEKSETVAQWIRDQIKIASGASVDLPAEFGNELCNRGRVLIIIDGLSERSEVIRNFLGLQTGTPPFRFVVFTSRTDEKKLLKQVALARLQPVRLIGDELWLFMRAYLDLVAGPRFFSEPEVMKICENLSDTAGDRDVTAMLATMYAGMEVSRKKKNATPDQPGNIPELMLEYVKQISERAGMSGLSIEEVQSALKCISWESVKSDFRPRPLSREAMVNALVAAGIPWRGQQQDKEAQVDAASQMVRELETNLKLLQPIGQQVKVVLDPLAEYLAAMYLAVRCGADVLKWKDFLNGVDEASRKYDPAEIRGFLLAVRDSAAQNKNAPDWLESALLERAKWDVRAQAESRRARRVGFFTRRLQQGDDDEKEAAIENIEAGGYIDAAAEAALVEAVKSGRKSVRRAAIYALGQLNSRSASAKEALSLALQDEEPAVRRYAIWSCEIAGPEQESMQQAILSLARDKEADVRQLVAKRLRTIGTRAAEPTLQRLLSDPDPAVRVTAAVTLTEIAPGGPSLRELANVLTSTEDLIDSLDSIGRKFSEYPEGLESLAKRLNDTDKSTRALSIRLIVKAAAEPPANSISKQVRLLLDDDDPDVAIWAAVALWNWNLATSEVRSLLRKLTAAKNGSTRVVALGLLAKMGVNEPDRKLLRDALNDTEDDVRIAAATALMTLDADTGEAFAVFRRMANSSTAQSRYDVVTALKKLRKTDAPVADLLIELLQDQNETVRKEAAECILDRKDVKALNALTRRIGDDSESVRKSAARAFLALNVAGDTELAPLRSLLQDSVFDVQLEAARSYWKLTGKVEEILPALFEFQSARLSFKRSEAFDLLAEMAVSGQSDSKLIKLGVEDGYLHTRHSAMKALLASFIIDDALTEKVIELLDDPYDFVRSSAVHYLARAGHLDSPTRKRILRLAGDSSGWVKEAAIEAIGEFDQPTEKEIQVVIEVVHAGDENVSGTAAKTLARTRACGEASIDALLGLLQQNNFLLKYKVTKSLEELVRDVPHADESLARAMQHVEDPEVRLIMLNALSGRDSAPGSVVQGIVEFLHDKSPQVRKRAAEVLGDSGSTDVAVLDTLQTVLKDEDVKVQAAAVIALERLAPGLSATTAAAESLMQSKERLLRLSGSAVLASKGIAAGRDAVREALRDAQFADLLLLRHLPRVIWEIQDDLKPLLKSSDANTRRVTAELLIDGTYSDDAIEALQLLLIEGKAVADVLRRAGKRAVGSIPALQRAIELGVESAMPALCELAPADVCIRSLKQALLQTRPEMQATAAAAIAKLGPMPDDVLQRLRELSHDPDIDVRIAARSALKSAALL